MAPLVNSVSALAARELRKRKGGETPRRGSQVGGSLTNRVHRWLVTRLRFGDTAFVGKSTSKLVVRGFVVMVLWARGSE